MISVAPHTGAWIETLKTGLAVSSQSVAPLTGAWIETKRAEFLECIELSHPTRVRGLKPKYAVG